MKKIYIIEGWFGDIEWVEDSAFFKEEDAEKHCDELWKTRNSPYGPPWTHGLQKFCVREMEIK